MNTLREFKWHLRTADYRPLCGAKTSRHLPIDQVRLVTCERCQHILATLQSSSVGGTRWRPRGGPCSTCSAGCSSGGSCC